MIIGIMPLTSSAETLLNNLAEANFDQVSLIMRDLKTRDAIAKDKGPFQGLVFADLTKKLADVGLSPRDIKTCTDGVAAGKVLIAIACRKEAEHVAIEMLNDYSPEFIKTV